MYLGKDVVMLVGNLVQFISAVGGVDVGQLLILRADCFEVALDDG